MRRLRLLVVGRCGRGRGCCRWLRVGWVGAGAVGDHGSGDAGREREQGTCGERPRPGGWMEPHEVGGTPSLHLGEGADA